MLATQAGVAVENARLYEEMVRAQDEVRRLEVLDERERIAKELHDGVIQSLFSVGMSLQGVAALAQDEGVSVRIEAAVEDIDGAIRDLRNYIFGLRPGILADRQLDQALRELGAEFEQRSGVVTVVDIDPGIAVRARLGRFGHRAGDARGTVQRRTPRRGDDLPCVAPQGCGGRDLDRSMTMAVGSTRVTWTRARHGEPQRRISSLGGSIDVRSSGEEGTAIRALLPL